MQYVTEYAKRRNTVKLSLNTKKKKMVQMVYRQPDNKLIKRLSYTSPNLEEIVLFYFRQQNKYRKMGYEIKEKKDGKIITPVFKK